MQPAGLYCDDKGEFTLRVDCNNHVALCEDGMRNLKVLDSIFNLIGPRPITVLQVFYVGVANVIEGHEKYKKGTRAIIAWLLKYAPPRYAQYKKITLNELSGVAISLVGKVKELPEMIHFHFRETIDARKRLSKYFRAHVDEREEDLRTLGHEHFTSSLSTIYRELCAGCGKATTGRRPLSQQTSPNSPTKDFGSGYACLHIEEPSDATTAATEDADLFSDSDLKQVCRATVEEPESATGPCIADDEMADAFELVSIIQVRHHKGRARLLADNQQKIQEVFTAIEASWSQVGRGKVHFAAAAFLTNLGFSELDRLEASLQAVDCQMDLAKLRSICQPILDAAANDCGKVKPESQLLDELCECKQILDGLRRGSLKACKAPCSTCRMRENLDKLVENTETNADRVRSLTLANLADDMLEMILSEKAPCSIIRNSSPAYADLGYVLTNTKGKDNETRLASGLQILTTSHNSLSRMTIGNKGRNHRLVTLQLAQQASKSVRTVASDGSCFPCSCPNTLSWHLQSLNNDLAEFMQYKAWNLYGQSGWVTGNHVLEILDSCNYYGAKLFEYRHFVSSIVHCYNILTQLAGLQQIPLLENLCEQYKHKFFPGGKRPTQNFRACWTRCIGARLKFKEMHKRQNHRNSWCMAIPAHTAQNAAGLGIRCTHDSKTERSGCPLFSIKQQDYQLTEAQWCELCSHRSSGRPRLGRKSCDYHTSGYGHRLTDMLPEIDRCLTSTSGSALLDHFQVFASCVRMISTISDKTHTEKKDMNCICFASAIIESADRIADARRFGKIRGACWTECEREGVVKEVMKAMRDEFGGRDVEEWYWKV